MLILMAFVCIFNFFMAMTNYGSRDLRIVIDNNPSSTSLVYSHEVLAIFQFISEII